MKQIYSTIIILIIYLIINCIDAFPQQQQQQKVNKQQRIILPDKDFYLEQYLQNVFYPKSLYGNNNEQQQLNQQQQQFLLSSLLPKQSITTPSIGQRFYQNNNNDNNDIRFMKNLMKNDNNNYGGTEFLQKYKNLNNYNYNQNNNNDKNYYLNYNEKYNDLLNNNNINLNAVDDDELNRLLVSTIQNQRPLNNDYDNRNLDYLDLDDINIYNNNNKQIPNNEQQLLLLELNKIIGNNNNNNNNEHNRQSLIDDDNININNHNNNNNDDDVKNNLNKFIDFNRKWKLQQTKTPLYREENMAIPYDEIEQQTNKRTNNKDDSVILINKNNNAIDNKLLENNNKRILKMPSNVIRNEHSIQTLDKPYRQQTLKQENNNVKFSSLSDIYFIAIVACVSTVAIFSVIGAGYCFYKVQQSNKAAADVDFPAYGVIGPASRTADCIDNNSNNQSKCQSPSQLNNDRKLVQSAQIYHYHHQKQQMISTEKNSNVPKNNIISSDIESDEENEDGEYTVYECPGLAPTGEMEIKNPLFQDDLTPMSSPSVNNTITTTTTKDNDTKQSINNQQQQKQSK